MKEVDRKEELESLYSWLYDEVQRDIGQKIREATEMIEKIKKETGFDFKEEMQKELNATVQL